MKKKLIKYAIDIANANAAFADQQFVTNNRQFVTDGYRILEIEEPLPSLVMRTEETNKFNIDRLKDMIDSDADATLDYVVHDLPSTEEIKTGIHAVCGRKFNRVAWSDGIITLNARWLLKTMEALNAKRCYISKTKFKTTGVFFYENDDIESKTKCLILPIYNTHNRIGFWDCPEDRI